MGSQENISVQATATTFEVIEALRDRDRAGVTELANNIGISKSAIHSHLSTLSALGYVQQTDGAYELTHRFLRLGLSIRERNPVYLAAKDEVENLARTTRECVNLVVPEADHGFYLYRVGGRDDHPIPEGGQLALHASAAGKCILAFRDNEAIDTFVAQSGLPTLTDRTITDPAELRNQLRSIRDQRVAFDRGEHTPSWNCVASPIVVNGRPVGAISMSGPAKRMEGKRLEEDCTGLVSSSSRAVELDLLDSDADV